MTTISSFLTLTNPELRGDLYKECITSALGFSDELVIVDGGSTDGSLEYIKSLDRFVCHRIKVVPLEWPAEFDWSHIGKSFQFGYEQCSGDWAFHLDCDFIMHQEDRGNIRQAVEQYKDAPALSFLKHQFILPDRFNLKSRLILAVNKRKYGDNIRFDSGGDKCQPALSGQYIAPGDVPETKIKFFNYEHLIKQKEQTMRDVGRMDRAYKRHFGKYVYGEDGTNQSAFDGWLHMMQGRFQKPSEQIPLDKHPAVMIPTIKNLKSEQWGYAGFNQLGALHNNYISEQ